jgi:GntR family transcriptional regulator
MSLAKSLPLYFQIYEALRSQMADGTYRPGSRLPSETALASRFGVTRMTVRQALGKLHAEGLILTRRGIGTFTAPVRFERQATRMTDLHEDLLERGHKPTSRVLSLRTGEFPPDLAERLGLPPGEPMLYISRLRLADDEPVAVNNASLRRSLCPGLEREDLREVSLYALLEHGYGLALGHAEQRVQAVLAAGPHATLLGVRRGSPLLHIERLTFLKDGRALGLTEGYYRADRYVLHSVVYR